MKFRFTNYLFEMLIIVLILLNLAENIYSLSISIAVFPLLIVFFLLVLLFFYFTKNPIFITAIKIWGATIMFAAGVGVVRTLLLSGVENVLELESLLMIIALILGFLIYYIGSEYTEKFIEADNSAGNNV